MQRISVAVVLFSVFILAGCMLFENQGAARPDQPAASEGAKLPRSDIVELLGTVVKKDLEGGFFAIDGDDGKTYEPINLPDAFKKNGMRVKATVRVRNDVGSIRMVGPIIEILEITAQ
jgi:hypothetical protein